MILTFAKQRAQQSGHTHGSVSTADCIRELSPITAEENEGEIHFDVPYAMADFAQFQYLVMAYGAAHNSRSASHAWLKSSPITAQRLISGVEWYNPNADPILNGPYPAALF